MAVQNGIDSKQALAAASSPTFNALTLTTPLTGANGGTGVNNGASLITVGASLTTTPANAVILTTTGATNVTLPTSGTLATTAQIPATPISLANGGTNASLTADNGGIFYSTATAGAILAHTATANQPLLSGASGAPGWSTATYPGSTTSQQILYSTANNVVGQLTTANSKFPATNSSGTLAMRGLSVVRQVFINTGTYTPTAGMLYCDIECLGGGGGGGGAPTTGATTASFGIGGGSGEYSCGVFSAATIGASQAVTIGAAGAANSGASGGNGGNTSVGALISANGGTGGTTSAAAAANNVQGVLGGTGGSGGDFRTPGQPSVPIFWVVATAILITGTGASSQYGAGGIAVTINLAGQAGLGFGSGGSGGNNFINQGAAVAGGAGTKGVVIVTEYVIA